MWYEMSSAKRTISPAANSLSKKARFNELAEARVSLSSCSVHVPKLRLECQNSLPLHMRQSEDDSTNSQSAPTAFMGGESKQLQKLPATSAARSGPEHASTYPGRHGEQDAFAVQDPRLRSSVDSTRKQRARSILETLEDLSLQTKLKLLHNMESRQIEKKIERSKQDLVPYDQSEESPSIIQAGLRKAIRELEEDLNRARESERKCTLTEQGLHSSLCEFIAELVQFEIGDGLESIRHGLITFLEKNTDKKLDAAEVRNNRNKLA